MAFNRRLQGGRGFHTDKAGMGDSYDLRRQQLDHYDGMVLGHLTSGANGSMDPVKRLALFIAPRYHYGFTLAYAKIGVASSAVGATIKTALYLLVSAEAKLKKIPGTEVSFDGSVPGSQAVALSGTVTIEPNAVVFTAVMADTLTVGVSGVPISPGIDPISALYLDVLSFSCPSEILLTQIIKGDPFTTSAQPTVTYLSKQAASLL